MVDVMPNLNSSIRTAPMQAGWHKPATKRGGTYRPTILVTEDDEVVRTATIEVLRETGYEGLGVGDGKQALAALDLFVVDLLITDIRLPSDVDGWKLAKMFRSRYPQSPVIYISGLPTIHDRKVAGGVVLQKPFRPMRLLSVVQDLTGAGRA